MSRPSISKSVRKFVAERAGFRCEYCRMPESESYVSFQVDHIASLKHGGGNEPENLAYICPHCNQFKGTDLTTFLDSYQDIVLLFNPRSYIWDEHFKVENGVISGRTRIGQATAKTLQFNAPDRIIHRQLLMQTGRYP